MTKTSMAICVSLCGTLLRAQDSTGGGLDLRATASALGVVSSYLDALPRRGSVGDGGLRIVVYPTLKLGPHWSFTGAYQLMSRPYYYESFTTQLHGFRGDLLQGTLNYARVSDRGSLSIRVGKISTAFGSFGLRYDSADNSMVGLPIQYGYYYAMVTNLGLYGAQLDVTRGKWDGRLQIVNASPLNPRSFTSKDQYGNWAGGAGYTIRQGLRIGFSAYYGPYLDRHHRFFFRGEANPNTLPARAVGVDGQWAHGHWNLYGEWQKFHVPYKAIPDFDEDAGYVEFKRVLSPRFYVAARAGYKDASIGGIRRSYEGTVGYRVAANQLFKIGYQRDQLSSGPRPHENTLVFEAVTTIHPVTLGWK